MAKSRPLTPEELTQEQAALYQALSDPRLREVLLRNLRVPEGDPEKARKLEEHADRVAAIAAALVRHAEDLRATAGRVRESEGHLDLRPLLRAPDLPGAQLRFTRTAGEAEPALLESPTPAPPGEPPAAAAGAPAVIPAPPPEPPPAAPAPKAPAAKAPAPKPTVAKPAPAQSAPPPSNRTSAPPAAPARAAQRPASASPAAAVPPPRPKRAAGPKESVVAPFGRDPEGVAYAPWGVDKQGIPRRPPGATAEEKIDNFIARVTAHPELTADDVARK